MFLDRRVAVQPASNLKEVPSNVLVANIQTGVINNYGNTSNAAPYWFLYQFINLRYANNATGNLGFNTVSSNANYFGTYNSTTSTPSGNPSDYTWTQVAGGFGATKTIYYSAIGGRQVVWVAANTSPSTSFVESVPNVAINLDTVTTATGTPGERGPVSMAYIVTPSDPTIATTPTLTGWFTAPAGNTVAPIGTGLAFPVPGDIATFTYANGIGKPTATNTFNGSLWIPAYAQRIDGNVIVGGTLAANAIVANSITATQIATESLTTNLFQANSISGNIITVNTLNGNTIQANTISGNTIIANTFSANSINGNSIVAGSIAANTINGNSIVSGSITTDQLAANVLTANTVISTGANIGNNQSQGFWLQGNTGDARFGNTVSIGNNLTIGTNLIVGTFAHIGANLSVGGNVRVGVSANIANNLTVGSFASIGANLTVAGNANIGSNLVVGSFASIGANLSVAGNASIGNNLTIGANATIGNNLSLGGNIRIGNNANIGNSVTIGNLLTIGNNATIGGNVSIGANLFVTGLINTGSLISNTVNTTTMLNGAVSGGIGNTSTTTINFVPPVFGTVYNANISSTITTIQANQDVYLWSQVPYFLSLGGYTSGNTWGSNVTVYLSRTTSNVSTTVFSQSYTTEQSVNQTSITGQAVFCGFIDTPATPATCLRAPYFERLCFLSFTPVQSKAPRIIL